MVGQLLLNAVIAASIYALIGVGFALVFRVVRFFHFTHGLYFAAGAYLTFLLRSHGLSAPVSGCAAVALVAVIAWSIDKSIFVPLYRRGAAPVVCLLASLGVYIVGQNILSISFGDAVLSVRTQTVTPGFEFSGARITGHQLVIVSGSVLALALLTFWLRQARFGKDLRAVANDEELARVVGVRSDRVRSAAVSLAAAIASLAGILSCLDRDMVPTMGMSALLVGVVAMVVGGKESLTGVVFGAFLIALAQNLSILWISAAWQEGIVFLILTGFLIFRPEGVLGLPVRAARV